jgi:hypothetical protein
MREPHLSKKGAREKDCGPVTYNVIQNRTVRNRVRPLLSDRFQEKIAHRTDDNYSLIFQNNLKNNLKIGRNYERIIEIRKV